MAPFITATFSGLLFYLVLLNYLFVSTSVVDFLFNSFNGTDLILVNDSLIEGSVIRLTNDSDANQYSIGRFFYKSPLKMIRTRNSSSNSNSTVISSFSTSFIFSIIPEIQSSPGFGLAFVLCNTTNPIGALSGQYFGLFTNSTLRVTSPLIAVKFDTGRNPEFNDPDGNHVGINLNSIESKVTQTAQYWNNGTNQNTSIDMRNGQNIRAWIEFNGEKLQMNVTIALAGDPKPSVPLISTQIQDIGEFLAPDMYVGFSASKVKWVERQRILSWSLNDLGLPARDLDTSNLPVFVAPSSGNSLPVGVIVGIAIASVVFVALCLFILYWLRLMTKKKLQEEEENVEEWELEYWPHRFTYDELSLATKGFSKEELLGVGGFGKVYKGILPKTNVKIAVKCISHDSKQGVKEFMAEISSMGRLQHKSLIHMRGWCRKGNDLMLVYDYMPNGSLNNWIFDKPKKLLNWEGRKKILADVAAGLYYLHHGWEQVVLHRDIKSSNILLDEEMRGKLGDFGLAKLYDHGETPSKTRLVGTLGYMAPELGHVPAPTSASDVYSFGMVMLEVACGRRPIEIWSDEEPQLVDIVRNLYKQGKIIEAADKRIEGEYKVEEMEMVLKLGLTCCHPDSQIRPTMKDVVEVLLGERAGINPEETEDLETKNVKFQEDAMSSTTNTSLF